MPLIIAFFEEWRAANLGRDPLRVRGTSLPQRAVDLGDGVNIVGLSGQQSLDFGLELLDLVDGKQLAAAERATFQIRKSIHLKFTAATP
jgi:hypothetical protein